MSQEPFCFPCGHATHPHWGGAASLVLAQLRAQLAARGPAAVPGLGLLYITDHYADAAQELLAYLQEELPEVRDWAGTVGIGIAVSNAEYFDEPALAVMLCALPADQYRVYSGVAPLGAAGEFVPHTALVHADPQTPELEELLSELAGRTDSGYLFGGLSCSRAASVQFARSASQARDARAVLQGGLSGVAFGPDVALVSRVTQGCHPLPGSAVRRVTRAEGNLVLALDGQPALQTLLDDLQVSLDQPQLALPALRATLVGLSRATTPAVGRTGHFGADIRVRHLLGVDRLRDGVAVADQVQEGEQLSFCRRDLAQARADLIRICAEIREELAPWPEQPVPSLPLAGSGAVAAQPVDMPDPPARRMLGALYISCSGRGGPHFGAPSAELQLIRHALGDVPLVGFFAAGEIAREQLYGYTGVLTVFVD